MEIYSKHLVPFHRLAARCPSRQVLGALTGTVIEHSALFSIFRYGTRKLVRADLGNTATLT